MGMPGSAKFRSNDLLARRKRLIFQIKLQFRWRKRRNVLPTSEG